MLIIIFFKPFVISQVREAEKAYGELRVCRCDQSLLRGFEKGRITHIRPVEVAAAKKLLAHTSYSVSEIAYQLNFADPGYFAHLFKKLTGTTPVAFRKDLT